MITDLTEIKNYLKDKNLCIIGNAKSILNYPKNIDNSYDIIGRMNHGITKGKETYIGSRTDILFTSTKIYNNEFIQFNPKYVVWMVEDLKRVPKYIENSIIRTPPEDWKMMKNQYPTNKLPSTGCLVINFLLKHIEFNSLTIYGFDFFKSGSHYHHLINQKWHPSEIEEKIITEMIEKHNNVEIIE